MKKLSILSGIKIPEYIRTEYPKLVTFVEAYYRYLELGTSIKDAEDVDTATEQFLKQHKESLLKGFGDPEHISIRNFIYANKEFFSKKGTAEAFEFFFRIYFREEIKVNSPDYLIASGGQSSGDYFMYVTIESGELNEFDDIKLTYSTIFNRNGKITAATNSDIVTCDRASFLSSDIGLTIQANGKPLGVIKDFINTNSVRLTENSRFQINQVPFNLTGANSSLILDTLRFEQLDSETYVIYFIPPRGFKSSVGDLVTVGNTFRGRIKETPAKIRIVKPGKFWQLGQIIVLPNSTNTDNTILRVRKINSDGGVAAVDILKYSYPLISEQYSISSLDSSSGTITDSTRYSQIAFDDGSFEERYSVFDNIQKTEDRTTISLVDHTDPNLYSDEEYGLEDYYGDLKYYQLYPEEIAKPTGYTDQEFADSFVTIEVVTDSFTKEYHKYKTDKSLISNSSTRLHDNLRYQAFAYSIETAIDIKKYRGSFDLLHPAGSRFNATHVKEMTDLNTDIRILGNNTFPTAEGNVITGNPGNVGLNFVMGIEGNNASSQIG